MNEWELKLRKRIEKWGGPAVEVSTWRELIVTELHGQYPGSQASGFVIEVMGSPPKGTIIILESGSSDVPFMFLRNGIIRKVSYPLDRRVILEFLIWRGLKLPTVLNSTVQASRLHGMPK